MMPYLRATIDVVLTTEALLHIGSGEPTHRAESDLSDIDIDAVAMCRRDGQSVPLIPGSSLRGVLRSLVARAEEGAANALFGEPEMGSRVAVLDAQSISTSTPQCPPTRWSPERRTGVYASTAIDPVTGAAAHGLLRHLETVQHGEQFRCQLVFDACDLSLLATATAALTALGEGAARLGSNTADGWGRVRCESPPVVRVATPEHVMQWFASGASTSWEATLGALNADDSAKLEAAASELKRRIDASSATVTVPVVLKFASPLMVASALVHQDADHLDAVTMRRTDGRVVLPADSVRGRLRQQAERIMRIRLNDDSVELSAPARVLIAAIFGDTTHQSALTITDFVSTASPESERMYTQQFVSIDRFTGGAAHKRLFSWQSAWHPTLEGSLGIDVQHFHAQYERLATRDIDTATALEQALALLALVLRDVQEGLVHFGAGVAKGYGRCAANLLEPSIGESAPIPAALRTALSHEMPAVTSDWAAIVTAALHTLPSATEAVARATVTTTDRVPPALTIAAPSRAPGQFRNPYHFVPAADDANAAGALVSANDIALDKAGSTPYDRVRETVLGHQWTAPRTLTGIIACTLRVETPTVIGAQQSQPDPESHRIVTPATSPLGSAIIPGSTLRGMISAVHEAATQSALRVLGNRVMSHRMRIERALPYIGQLEVRDGRYFVRPLCIGPTRDQGRGRQVSAVDRALFPSPNLRVYLQGKIVDALRSDDADALTGYHAVSLTDLDRWETLINESTPTLHERWQVKVKAGRTERIIGRYLQTDSRHGVMRWDDVPVTEQPQRLRGRLLVMGRSPMRALPRTKKHELFVPVPSRVEHDTWPVIPVGQHVIQRFHDLADEVFDDQLHGFAQLPYEPVGQGRGRQSGSLRLKHGDLVWFDAALNERTLRITKVALSSVWRSAVGEDEDADGSLHSFFGGLAPHLRPYWEGKPMVTTSEAVFGFASDRDCANPEAKDSAIKRVTAYASRVSFDFAALDATNNGDPFLPAVTLRALLSPKPPSPSLYFKPADTEVIPPVAVEKEALAPSTAEELGTDPQGRKFYLHQSANQEPWRSPQPKPNAKLKAQVTPLEEGTTFTFNVRFTGLLPVELNTLLFALKPSDAFRHKVGMGKPLGLGTVELNIAGLTLLNLQERYGNDGWGRSAREDVPKATWEAARNRASLDLASRFPHAYRALRLIGESTNLIDVRTPLTAAQIANDPRTEENTYEWFVRNRDRKQVLAPLTRSTTELPRLDHN